MPRTDDLRIREMKELIPPSHLIREFAVLGQGRQTAVGAAAPRSIASCTGRTTACWW